MNDIRKLLDIINETTAGATASGGVAPVSQSMHTQRRVEEDYTEESSDKPQMPQILEYGNWENSALTTSKKLKKSRKKASKIVKSVYGEDMPGEKKEVTEGSQLARTARKIIPGLGRMQAKMRADHEREQGRLAMSELPGRERKETEPDDEYWSTRAMGNRHYDRAKKFDKIASGVDESVVDESGLQAYLGNKKYGKEGMDALRRAGREGASKEKMAKLRAKYDKLDEENVAETKVGNYKDLGATSDTTHFIKNVTTGKIVSPHRSRQDAEDALIANKQNSNDEFKIVRARKEGVAEGSENIRYEPHPNMPKKYVIVTQVPPGVKGIKVGDKISRDEIKLWAGFSPERKKKSVAEGVSAQDKNISVGDYVQTAAGVEGVVKHISPDGKKLTIWNRKRQADHRVDITKAEKIPGIARRKMAEQGVAEGPVDTVKKGIKHIKRVATGKDLDSRIGQEITKSHQAVMRGDYATSKKHFDRYDKLDKLANKEQGVAEGSEDTNPFKRAIDIATSLGYSVKESPNGKVVTFHSVPSQLTMKAKLVNLSGKDMVYWEAGGAYDTISANKFPNFFKGLHQAHMHDIKKDKKGVTEGSEQSAYIKYNQGYNDAKNSKPSIHKTLTGNDRHNYVMGYKDGLTDRKKPKEQGVAEGANNDSLSAALVSYGYMPIVIAERNPKIKHFKHPETGNYILIDTTKNHWAEVFGNQHGPGSESLLRYLSDKHDDKTAEFMANLPPIGYYDPNDPYGDPNHPYWDTPEGKEELRQLNEPVHLDDIPSDEELQRSIDKREAEYQKSQEQKFKSRYAANTPGTSGDPISAADKLIARLRSGNSKK